MLELALFYYPAEADVPAIYAARAGSIQATGDTPSQALEKLAEELTRRFPRPLLGAPAPIWEG